MTDKRTEALEKAVVLVTRLQAGVDKVLDEYVGPVFDVVDDYLTEVREKLEEELAKPASNTPEPETEGSTDIKVGDIVEIYNADEGLEEWNGLKAEVLEINTNSFYLPESENSQAYLKPLGSRPFGTGDFYWPRRQVRKTEPESEGTEDPNKTFEDLWDDFINKGGLGKP